MIAELGLIFLIFSMVFSFFQILQPVGKNFFNSKIIDELSVYIKLANTTFFVTLFSFLCLTYSFIVSDFSLLITTQNSNSELPLLYKITGVWGNHEGSILLWLLVMTFFNFLLAKSNIEDSELKKTILIVQGSLCFLISLFIILTSNPFDRVFPPEIEGRDLNPLLQDPGLAIHPPFLYLGYVGFSIVYSMAIGALIKRRITKEFISLMKPWIYLSWTFLTCGIGLGSWWAYYELGWGGFWFWDPVENASLLPWLTGTALLHSVIVAERKGSLLSWTLLLAIITFSLSLLGTFLVRSGVLVSVHAFANDPGRGIFILLLLTAICGFGIYIFIKNSKSFSKDEFIEPISREGAISLNNIFMVTIASTILIGTLYPLISDVLFGKKISVGAPFFNSIILPFIFPLVIGMIFGPFLRWGKDDFFQLIKRLKVFLYTIFIISLCYWYFQHKGPVLAIISFTFSIWLIVGSLFELFSHARIKYKNNSMKFWRIPKKVLSQSIAHLGVAFLIIGATGGSILKKEKIQFQTIGEKVSIGSYQLEFVGVQNKSIDNYESDYASFKLYKNNKFIKYIHPEKRHYNFGKQVTTEAAIHSTLLGDIYVAIGDKSVNFKESSSWTTRIWYNPFVLWIWFGVLFMATGGLISLLGSREPK